MFKKTALAAALMTASLAFAADPAVKPGDDFFNFVNGDWIAKTEIPADRSTWGAFPSLSESTNARIVKLIEGVPADAKASADAKKVHAYYQAIMDEAAIEAKGMAPVKPMLDKIAAIGDKAALAAALGASLRADVDPLNTGYMTTENLFGLWANQGLKDPSRYVPHLLQGGLGLPDRAYYVDDNPRMAELRAKYQTYVATLLQQAGMDKAEARAAKVLALETAIAKSHVSRVDAADVSKSNNLWSMADFSAKAPGMDWKAFFGAAKLADQKQFTVWHTSAVIGAAALVASEDLAAWKDWLAFHQLNRFAGALPKAVTDAHFAFYGSAMSGTPQQAARWKQAMNAVNGAMEDAVGRMYVEKYFPAEHKARLQKMVADITHAFSLRVDKLDWMAPATRAEAKRKLQTLYVGIAYPEHWENYSKLEVKADDAFGNAVRADRFQYEHALHKLHEKVNKKEWAMPPHRVNAINLPLQNALNFPAAILQPPFFDPKASDAVNYGAIGSVIGHEISHSFDDQGALFDSQGRLRNWWSEKDEAQFKASSKALVDQYSSYKPFPDLALNGQQTLGENLSDLAGVAAALDAYKATPAGKAAGVQGVRDFFMGYGQAWQYKARDAALRRQVMTDGHSPAPYRVATVRNLDAWYEAFDVKPGDKLYLPPEQRVKAW